MHCYLESGGVLVVVPADADEGLRLGTWLGGTAKNATVQLDPPPDDQTKATRVTIVIQKESR